MYNILVLLNVRQIINANVSLFKTSVFNNFSRNIVNLNYKKMSFYTTPIQSPMTSYFIYTILDYINLLKDFLFLI